MSLSTSDICKYGTLEQAKVMGVSCFPYFDAGTLIFLVPILIVIYMFPTEVAYFKGKRDRFSICLLNIFLGISGVGWVIALVWAFLQDKKETA